MKNNAYEVNKEIVFSTAHITERDDRIATHITGFSALIVEKLGYGFRVLLNSDGMNKLKDTMYSAEFANIYIYSIGLENDCKWLVFDIDGQIYDNLSTFE